MWRTLKNFFYSFWTYADLSPDLRLRRRVNESLANRPAFNKAEWYQVFWQPLGVSHQISDFVYTQLQECSGLEIRRVCPDDLLIKDLYLPLICWFDWESTFCTAFLNQFGVDLEIYFSAENFATVEDLVLFLNHQLLSVNRS